MQHVNNINICSICRLILITSAQRSSTLNFNMANYLDIDYAAMHKAELISLEIIEKANPYTSCGKVNSKLRGKQRYR